MSQTIVITPKWQVHIPVEVRKLLSLTRPTQVEVSVKDKAIMMKPLKRTILDAAGSLSLYGKKRKDINLDKIREVIDYGDL